MQEIINMYLNQAILSILLFANTTVSNVLPAYSINLIENGTVIRVVDGDTIEVYQDNQIKKVRLIGVNTPETVDPRKDVQCYGLEASLYLKKEIEGKKVTLESDPTQQNKDTYGRDLRYVILNGENINKKIIENGYGFEYTYKVPYKFQEEFKIAEENARSDQKGLWDKENCNY